MAPAFIETLDSAQLVNYFDIDDNFEVGIMPPDYITSVTFLLNTYLAQLAAPWNHEITELLSLRLDEEGMKAIFGTSSSRVRNFTLFAQEYETLPLRRYSTKELCAVLSTQSSRCWYYGYLSTWRPVQQTAGSGASQPR
jgi:hypothetical protein